MSATHDSIGFNHTELRKPDSGIAQVIDFDCATRTAMFAAPVT